MSGAVHIIEREIIRDRTMAGLTAARARGRVGGRPSKLSAEQRRQARKMYDERELTVEQIAQVLSVSRTSIYWTLSKTTTAMMVPSGTCTCRSDGKRGHTKERPRVKAANPPGAGA